MGEEFCKTEEEIDDFMRGKYLLLLNNQIRFDSHDYNEDSIKMESRIRWMQETQGLRALGGEEEAAILSYLSVNYPQKASSRRAGLPAHLLPSNPAEASD